MFGAVGAPIDRLVRVRIGPVRLDDLPSGRARRLRAPGGPRPGRRRRDEPGRGSGRPAAGRGDPPVPRPSPMTATLWNARLIDGRGGAPVERATVTIEDGRIAAIGTRDGRAAADAIDVGGRTLMPGLIDAHAHVSSDTERSPGFGPPPPLHGDDPRPRELGYFVLVQLGRGDAPGRDHDGPRRRQLRRRGDRPAPRRSSSASSRVRGSCRAAGS